MAKYATVTKFKAGDVTARRRSRVKCALIRRRIRPLLSFVLFGPVLVPTVPSTYSGATGYASMVSAGAQELPLGEIRTSGRKHRHTLNKNLSSLSDPQGVADAVRELILAVVELQEQQIGSRVLDKDGFPKHGSRCELMDGVFVRLQQMGPAPTVVTVNHGLKRKPQGVWWIHATAWHQVLIAGDTASKVAVADKEYISIRMNGAAGDTAVCVVF